MVEVIRGGGYDGPTPAALMLDQCHNIEKKVPGQIRSVLNVQEMVARALLLDTPRRPSPSRSARVTCWPPTRSTWTRHTDVRRDLAGFREERGLPADPMAAYLASGYQDTIEADRVGGLQAGWN